MRGYVIRSSLRRGATRWHLLELPRGLTAEQLAGGFGLPGAVRLSGSIEDSFRQRISVTETADIITNRIYAVVGAIRMVHDEVDAADPSTA
jgi:hypothetical protein